jgi:hypothetical protein
VAAAIDTNAAWQSAMACWKAAWASEAFSWIARSARGHSMPGIPVRQATGCVAGDGRAGRWFGAGRAAAPPGGG